jgi:DNA-3-methyladenine glycosylase
MNDPSPLSLLRLSRQDLPLGAPALARFLIGKLLVHQVGGLLLSGRIVETEAYLADDPSCHGFNGITKRNRSLFLTRGHAYVYLSYGCWPLLNVSAGEDGEGTGVLFRALEPRDGLDAMRSAFPNIKARDLARGPGRLARAMQVGMELDGLDFCAPGPLWLSPGSREPAEIGASVRIGITKAADLPLRFFEKGNAFVSGPRSLNLTTVPNPP